MSEVRLIDANALKEVITKLSNNNPSYYYTGDLLDREKVIDEIAGAPTIEEVSEIEFKEPLPMVKAQKIVKTLSKRPKCKWKTVKGIDGDEYYECSTCGEPWVLMAGTPKDNNMNFCPNCGADMRGGEQENDDEV